MAEQNETLSERELEILRLVATGAANKEIARQLAISPNTVKVHLRNIFNKAGVVSRTEATLYAIQLGLVTPGSAQISEEGLVEAPDEELPDEASSLTTGLSSASLESTLSTQTTTRPVEPLAIPIVPLPSPVEKQKIGIPIWQIGMFALLAVLVVGVGFLLIRTLAPAPAPTVAAQATQVPGLGPQHWSKHANLPSPRKGMGVAEYENQFYLIGGESASGVDGAVLRFDPATETWKTLKSKPTPVTEAQAALLGEKIFVPGGQLASGETTNHLDVYNPRTDSWESKAPLPVPLSAYALAPFEGRLYLFGGKSGNTYSDKVYEYDPQQDRWQERSKLSEARAYAGAVTIGGKIHVLGGFDGKQALTNNEVYFPTRDDSNETAWEKLTALPQGRYGMGTTTLGGMIFMFGGMTENNAAPTPPALEFQVQMNQWAIFDTPTEGSTAFSGLLASGNFLYLLGGETTGAQPAKLSDQNQSYQALYSISVPIIVK